MSALRFLCIPLGLLLSYNLLSQIEWLQQKNAIVVDNAWRKQTECHSLLKKPIEGNIEI